MRMMMGYIVGKGSGSNKTRWMVRAVDALGKKCGKFPIKNADLSVLKVGRCVVFDIVNGEAVDVTSNDALNVLVLDSEASAKESVSTLKGHNYTLCTSMASLVNVLKTREKFDAFITAFTVENVEFGYAFAAMMASRGVRSVVLIDPNDMVEQKATMATLSGAVNVICKRNVLEWACMTNYRIGGGNETMGSSPLDLLLVLRDTHMFPELEGGKGK
jgi:hypothetical protein